MDPPSKCDDEDRRACMSWPEVEAIPRLPSGSRQGLARETPEQDYHKALRDSLGFVGMTDQEIAVLTAAYFRTYRGQAVSIRRDGTCLA